MPRPDWNKIIGSWQLVGGIAGAATFLPLVRPGVGRDSLGTALVAVVPLCALSVLFGWALIRGHSPSRARGWSAALWAL